MADPRILILDFETFYDDDYTLRKMSPAEYILDPRFEVSICGVQKGWDGVPRVIAGPDLPAFLATYDPNFTVTVTFNSLFDNSILAWRYGFTPVMMLDAMNMARALRGHLLPSLALGPVAQFFGMPGKLGALPKVKGMSRQQIIDAGLMPEFEAYCADDVHKCATIAKTLMPEFPHSERKLMDLVLRCAIEPVFDVDEPLLEQHLAEVRASKAALMAQLGDSVTKRDLMSTDKFKALLEERGVTIQYKTTAAGKQTPAFAKTDKFMEELSEHDDPMVQALAAARLGHKSTLEESRCEKLLRIARLSWHNYRDGNPRLYSGGRMPVPLRFSGAHTHRLSGDWGMNMQNLPRGGNLRRALIAPPGHKVVAADLAQIEARLVAWICRQMDLCAQFENKEDLYSIFAGFIFGRTINRKLASDKVEGFIGKTGILGLGYGCGPGKFYDMVMKLGRLLGIDPTAAGFDNALAFKTVGVYRSKYWKIRDGWKRLDDILRTAWLGKGGPINFGPVTISRGRVDGPNGLALLYEHTANPAFGALLGGQIQGPLDPAVIDELWYKYGRLTHKIYGAKMLENIVQFLARIIIMNAALRIRDRTGLRFVLQAHDELVFIIPDKAVDLAKQIIYTEMIRRPSWGPDLPLDAEVHSGANYGECK